MKKKHEVAAEDVLSLYPDSGGLAKFLLRTRFWGAPLSDIEGLVPDDARIMELGCGQGMLANYLKMTSEKRRIQGIDLSAKRIASARKTVQGRSGIEFVTGDITDESLLRFDQKTETDAPIHYIICQVLYLLSEKQAIHVLSSLAKQMRPGDRLIVADYSQSPLRKYWFLRFENYILSMLVKLGTLFPGRYFTELLGERSALARIPDQDKWFAIFRECGLGGNKDGSGTQGRYTFCTFLCETTGRSS